jgi:hypothetical protein
MIPKISDTAQPTEEEVKEFENMMKHFPKPYTKAEKKMLAKEDQQIEETSDSEDAEDE